VASGANGVLVPILVGSALAAGDDVIALESRPTTATRPGALPAIPFDDAADETAVFFIIGIERWCSGKRAKHLRTHEVEDFSVCQGLSRESFAGLPGLIPNIEQLIFQHENERLLLHRGKRNPG
jgi:hypothetical protein